jgi:hypothetical protein
MSRGKTVRNVLRITRSDPDRIVARTMGKNGRAITALEDLRENTFPRTDIGLVNLTDKHCPTCTCTKITEQVDVWATKSGEPMGAGLKYGSEEDIQWWREENQRLIAVAAEHPEFEVFLH